MKAIVKASEETVEVFQYGKHHFLEYIGEKTGRLFLAEELDLLDNDPDYWTRLEHQYAGMAMQGILSNQDYCKLLIDEDNKGSFAEDVSRCASDFAHALVEKLKEKEERK